VEANRGWVQNFSTATIVPFPKTGEIYFILKELREVDSNCAGSPYNFLDINTDFWKQIQRVSS
jgi:hypothetical protein